MSYVVLEDFKRYVNVTRDVDMSDDGLLQGALDSAEELINGLTSRTFAVTDGSPTTRTYAADFQSPLLLIDDAVSISVIVDNTTTLVAGTDYLPVGEPGQPYSQIQRYMGNWWWDSYGRQKVIVTGVFGWPSIPAAIRSACMILAKDIVANQNVSFGIAAFTEYAGIRARENPQVAMLLAPYSHRLGFG